MKKHFILYQTTNLATGQYYIGVHGQTQDDNYLGSGIRFKRQLQKYGKEAFSRETLAVFATESEAFQAEITLLKEHLNKPLCLNISQGGDGGPNFKRLEGEAKKRSEERTRTLRESRRRTCPQCGQEFDPDYPTKVYCCKECSARASYKIAASASKKGDGGTLSEDQKSSISLKMMGNQNVFKTQSREDVSNQGKLSAHNRWHVNRNLVSPDCELCSTEASKAS